MTHIWTSAFSPATNLAEHVHQQLNRDMRIFVNKLGKAWDTALQAAAFSYNVGDLAFAPFSPYYLVHLFHPVLPAELKVLEYMSEEQKKELLSSPPDLGDFVASRVPLQR